MSQKKLTHRQRVVFQSILNHFNWSGSIMIFPYIGGRALIKVEDLFKIIKWQKQP